MTLDEFIVAYEQDDNLWWRTEAGEHQCHFEELVDRCAALRGERDEALASIKRMQDYFGDVTITAKKLEEAEAALSRYREAVEWALKHWDSVYHPVLRDELRRRAGM